MGPYEDTRPQADVGARDLLRRRTVSKKAGEIFQTLTGRRRRITHIGPDRATEIVPPF
jgi:hypothetical protein